MPIRSLPKTRLHIGFRGRISTKGKAGVITVHICLSAGKYPKASVWVSPGQYGPFGSCGLTAASARLGYRVDGVLPVGKPQSGDPLPPWADEFEMRTLYVSLPENAGPVSEAAFYHRPSKSLVAVDAVVFVPDAPPPIFRTYFDDATIAAEDFWPKTVLQA